MSDRPIPWDKLPPRLLVLRPVVEGHEPTLRAIRISDSSLSEQDQKALAEIRNKLEFVWSNDIARELEEWESSARNARPSIKSAAWVLGALLFLAESPTVRFEGQSGLLLRLPHHCAKFGDAARRYRFETAEDAIEYQERLTSRDAKLLKSLARELQKLGIRREIDDFLDKHSMVSHSESRWLYNLLVLLDYVDTR